jgi:hypothetical protein
MIIIINHNSLSRMIYLEDKNEVRLDMRTREILKRRMKMFVFMTRILSNLINLVMDCF